MKISTENFNKYAKIIEASYKKEDKRHKYLCLNFESSEASFSGEHLFGKLAFEFEFEAAEAFPSISVDKNIFLTLCSQYDTLYLNEDYEFYNGEEKFKIPLIEEEMPVPEIEENNFTSYFLTSNLIRNIKTAMNYAGSHSSVPGENFYGVSLWKNEVIANDISQIFEAQVDEKDEDGNPIDYPNIRIRGDIARLISSVASLFPTYLFFNEENGDVYFTIGEGEELRLTTDSADLTTPDVFDEDHISKYKHDTSLCVEKSEIINILDFLEVFVTTVPNQQICFRIIDEETLSVESQSDTPANRQMALKECSEALVGEEFWVSRSLVKKAVASINDDFIVFQFDTDQPAFNTIGETNIERHVATIRFV